MLPRVYQVPLVLALFLSVFTRAVAADQAVEEAMGQPDREIIAISVADTDAEAIADIVAGLYGDLRVVADPVTRTVLITGPQEEARAAEVLARQLADDPRRQFAEEFFFLKHARAEAVARILEPLLKSRWDRARVDYDPSGNLVVAAATVPLLREATRIVNELERTAAEARDEQAERLQTRVYKLEHRDPESLTEMVDALRLAVSEDGQIATDRRAGVIIVRSDPKTLATVGTLFSELDRPDAAPERSEDRPASYRIRLVWLVTPEQEPDLPPPPPDLKPVVDELEQLGVTGLRLAAQTLVESSADRFQVTASPLLSRPTRLDLNGRFQPARSSMPLVQLELRASQQPAGRRLPALGLHHPSQQPTGRGMEDVARLSTTLTVPTGHPVVLGVTPTGQETSVFVLQLF